MKKIYNLTKKMLLLAKSTWIIIALLLIFLFWYLIIIGIELIIQQKKINTMTIGELIKDKDNVILSNKKGNIPRGKK